MHSQSKSSATPEGARNTLNIRYLVAEHLAWNGCKMTVRETPRPENEHSLSSPKLLAAGSRLLAVGF